MESDNGKGLILAVASSVFIGSSFIVKKKGLKRAAANGTRAGLHLITNKLAYLEFKESFVIVIHLMVQVMEVIHTYSSLFGGRAWSLVSLSHLIYIIYVR